MIRLEREYEVTTDTGSESLFLRFEDAPTPVEASECGVRIELDGAGEAWSTTIYAMDETQALLFAMRIARVRLETTTAFKECRLRVRHWGRAGDVHLPTHDASPPEAP